jgi:hypothetical protein
MDLVTPCKDCPFRTDKPFYLTMGRVREILRALVERDQTFPCHKTVDYAANEQADEDDGEDQRPRIGTEKEQHCAGAMILLEHMERPNQLMRIAERIRLYDRTKLKMDSPVFTSAEQMLAHFAKQNRATKAQRRRRS